MLPLTEPVSFYEAFVPDGRLLDRRQIPSPMQIVGQLRQETGVQEWSWEYDPYRKGTLFRSKVAIQDTAVDRRTRLPRPPCGSDSLGLRPEVSDTP